MAAMLLIKASILLAITLGAARLLRRTAASTRHRLWSLGFAALLALPLLVYWVPVLPVPVPAAWRFATTPADAPLAVEQSATTALVSTSVPTPAAPPLQSNAPTASAAARHPRGPAFTATTWLIGVWAFGSVVAVSALLLSLLRVHRLASRATLLTDEDWRAAAETACRSLRFGRHVRLVLSDSVRTPMAGGLLRPTIFLPSSAPAWPTERRDVVLAHEIAHLAGADPLRHVAARLAVALYWFHPLAWLAAREATVAREQACDETVLALGTRPSSYAQVLLDFAESVHTRPMAALPIVERSLLERRLMAILADQPNRSARPRPLVLFAVVAALATAVAAAHPAAPAPLPVVHAAAVEPDRVTDPVPVVASAIAVPQPSALLELDCTAGTGAGRSAIYDQIGTRGSDRIILRWFGDLQLCMVAKGLPDGRQARPSEWLSAARQIVIEARHARAVQRLEQERDTAGTAATVWKVGAVERPFDAAAQQWRDRMLAVLDAAWDLSMLHGQVSTLRGEMSTVRGEESTLLGRISTLTGELSSMQGRVSTIRGEESTLHGELSTIRGHVSSLQGAISTERGAISGLEAMRFAADADERSGMVASIRRHEAEMARLEKELRDYGAEAKSTAVERRLRAFDADRQVAAIEAEIKAFDIDGKVATVERLLRELAVEDKLAALDKALAALDAEGRSRTLEQRLAEDLRRLNDLLARIK